MTLTIDLSPAEEEQLASLAHERGIAPEQLVKSLVTEVLPATRPERTPENDPTLALLRKWAEEDATDDPEELRQAEQDLLEFKRNMNRWRKEAGARLLFPEVE